MSRVLCNARTRTQDTYREREGACPGVSGFAAWAPSRVDMCALQILSLLKDDVSHRLTYTRHAYTEVRLTSNMATSTYVFVRIHNYGEHLKLPFLLPRHFDYADGRWERTSLQRVLPNHDDPQGHALWPVYRSNHPSQRDKEQRRHKLYVGGKKTNNKALCEIYLIIGYSTVTKVSCLCIIVKSVNN